jgi:hypothetical protein
VVALALALSVLGCTGGGSHPSSAATPPTHGSATTATSAQSTTSTSVSVPQYDPAKNARQDVVAGACSDGGDKGWSLEGTVTNSGATPRGYSIVVDFITVPGDTVMATRVVTVPPLAPHASASWSATGAVPGQKNLTCVIRQSTVM